MKRNKALKILNPVLLVLLVSQALTGLFNARLSPWVFEFFHKGGGILLIVLVVVHLILNFNWLKANYFTR
ncbi:MAG TPA: hypothetical protein VMW72_21340 [Sedimentisphaerales bacterium]|nr:hypothetical protein [Sedimentisphaerales bacterium]